MTWAHARASQVADQIASRLAGGIEHIAVVGAIRRGEREIPGIEILAAPIGVDDLFGEEKKYDELSPIIGNLLDEGWLAWRSPMGRLEPGKRRYALAHVPSSIPVDLITTRPPAQWGAVLALRTGPQAFTLRFAKGAEAKGRRLEHACVSDAVTGALIPTPDERSFFVACGVPWVAPDRRRP